MATEAIDGNSIIQYFEHDQYVGDRRRYSCAASLAGERYSGYWPHTAFVCPQCGELWARAIVTHQFDYRPYVEGEWAVEVRKCGECGGGELLHSLSYFDNVSPPLLLREVIVLLNGVEL